MLNQLVAAPLEDWLRDYYFTAAIDISSSGVENYSFGDLRRLLGITHDDLDHLVFRDSASLGSYSLRSAIAKHCGHSNPHHVMATSGSSEAIFLIMLALLQAEDEVIVLDPCYHSLVNIAQSIGCQLKRWPLHFESGFEPNLEDLRSLISTKTRMIIVNFPHNPTGTTISVEDQHQVVGLANELGAYLLWDAAFADLTYAHQPLTDISLLYNKGISFGTLSKAYGLPGLRVGWCIAPPEVLARCIQIRDYTTLALSPLVELIAQQVMEQSELILESRKKQATKNLTIVSQWMEEHKHHVEWIRPKGGVTAFPRLRSVADSEAFCHQLMQKNGVLLVPGTCFQHPQHVRLGFGGPTAELQEGLIRLAGALNSL